MIKFDGTNNFGMQRCEVIDALTMSNLEDAIFLEEKQEETPTKDWEMMNRGWCGVIRSYLTQDIKYHVMIEILAKKIWEILESRNLIKSIKIVCT